MIGKNFPSPSKHISGWLLSTLANRSDFAHFPTLLEAQTREPEIFAGASLFVPADRGKAIAIGFSQKPSVCNRTPARLVGLAAREFTNP
jgi:hypothetical protein